MKGSQSHSSLSKNSMTNDNEIDFGIIANTLKRHRLLIFKFAGASLLLSGTLAFLSKPVWEGQFQIVLEDQDSGSGKLSQLAAANPLLANLAGVGNISGETSLETEVEILESPSVLKPIFDYMVSQKAKSGLDTSSLEFTKWRKNNVFVELKKGTSVLNISYRDP